jgi:hypothetical protein
VPLNDVAAVASPSSTAEFYDPQYVLLEGVLAKLTSGFSMFGSKYKWESRYVVLTPTNLLYFKDAQQPKPSTKPKTDLYLGEETRVEEVLEEELPVRSRS